MNKNSSTGLTDTKKTRKNPVTGFLKWFFTLPFPVAIGWFLWLTKRWVFSLWSELDVNEVLFHLNAPLEGTGNGMIGSFLMSALVPAIAIAAAVSFGMYALRKWFRGEGKLWYKVLRVMAPVLGLALFAHSFRGFWNKLDVSGYIRDQRNTSAFIEEHYADPARTQITFPEKKRNLIMIYLESMEVTFADPDSGGSFPQNLIPELTQLARESEDFSGSGDTLNGGRVMPGTGFTMGAMFGISTGLPLKTDIKGFANDGDLFEGNDMATQEHFYDGAAAIGDILEEQGYRQIFLLGSDATFGGRRLFFDIHGSYEIEDYLYAQEQGWIPEDYHVFWGYEDEKLFEYARNTLLELQESDQPFNLTLLTVDTHFEDGYICRLCENEFEGNQYANVMACSSRQVAAFVDWCKEQDFYEDTAIVITGDHTTMDHDFCADVPSDYQRLTYTAFVNPAAENADPGRRREYSTLDIFPTTIAAMGAKIEGDRLGLGTDLFSGRDTLIEELGADTVKSELRRRSSFMENLSGIDVYSKTDSQSGISPTGKISIRAIDGDGTATFRLFDISNLNVFIEKATLELYETDSVEAGTAESGGDIPDPLVSVAMDRVSERVYSADIPVADYDLGSLSARASIVTKTGEKAVVRVSNDLRFCISDIDLYLQTCRELVESGEYTMLLSVRGDAADALAPQTQEELHALGLREDIQSGCSYCAVINSEQVTEQSSADGKVSYVGTLPDGKSVTVYSGGTELGDTARMLINGNNKSRDKRGLNIILYRNADGAISDSINFDTHELTESGVYNWSR